MTAQQAPDGPEPTPAPGPAPGRATHHEAAVATLCAVVSLIGVLAAYFLLPLRRLEEVPAGLSLTAAVVLLGGFGVRAIVGAARTARAGR